MQSQSAQILQQLQGEYGTANWDKWQKNSQPMYDYVYYPAAGAPTGLNFFSIQCGSRDANAPTGVVKTLEDTNFRTGGQITPNYLEVMQIQTHVRIVPKARQPAGIGDNAGNIYQNFSTATVQTQMDLLFRSGVLTISVDSKPYAVINQPFITAPAGFGLNIVQFAQQAAAGPVVSPNYWTQSNPVSKNIWIASPQIVIAPGQVIVGTLTFPDANYAVFTSLVNSTSPLIQLGVILNGILYRSAQ